MEIISNVEPLNKLVITKLAPAAKNQNRVNIYVNDEYSFSLDISQVVDFKIKVGQSVTDEQISEYQHASEFGKLYQRTLEWVLIRPRSIREARDHLTTKRYRRISENNLAEKILAEKKTNKALRKEKPAKQFKQKTTLRVLPVFSEEDIELIIGKLIEKGFLDDEKFTRFYVENRFVKKGISKKRLKMELAKKGIDQSIVEDVLSEGQRDDVEEIKKIILKKQNKYTPEKLIAYLARQGFDFQLSRDVVREMDLQNPEQNLFS